MRFAVYGTGGVGGYFGGRLARAGEDVTFVARGAHLEAIRANGLLVSSVQGDFTVPDAKATDMPSDIGPVDAVLVAVKAWQVPEIAALIRPLIGPDTCVVPLQNGVDAAPQLIEGLGPEHVVGGLCRVVALIGGPGHILHNGGDDYVGIAELDNRPSERVESVRAALAAAGLKAETPSDIHTALWAKFLFICAWGGVGAVTRSPVGVTRSMPLTRAMLEKAMTETYDVARSMGVTLPDTAVATGMTAIDRQPEGGEASMQRDIQEGRPSELEAQNGAVVRLGRESGVPTPTHDFIYGSLLPQELRARS